MTTAPSLYTEAATEIEAVADSLAESHRIRGGADMWDSDAPRHEYVRLMDLARRLRAADRRPDPLGEALNSGDGSYRP